MAAAKVIMSSLHMRSTLPDCFLEIVTLRNYHHTIYNRLMFLFKSKIYSYDQLWYYYQSHQKNHPLAQSHTHFGRLA